MNEPSNGGAPESGAPPRCLVVDDEPRLRQALVRVMTGEGFSCVEAANGVEALDALARVPAALVLSDLRMPRMDGVELLGEVRARYPDTAVILISAVAEVEVAVRCLTVGAMDYLTKPFNLDEVRARVDRAMERRRLVLENRRHQATLEARVAAQARRLETMFLATIQSFADALEVKDGYTRGHSARVSRYAAAIARRLALPAEDVREIELGGHVHDIGKIGVREAVLNKPEPLTVDEYEHIMTHPLVGWRILAPVLVDAPIILNIVRSHHERFDGRGVPDGLAGEAIPLEARIAAVADSFDAMTSGRPYRRGARMSSDEAVEELETCSGSQFDPAVVRAFVHGLRDGEIGVDLGDAAKGETATQLVTVAGGNRIGVGDDA